MKEENFHNYHSQKLIEALTSLIEQRDVDRKGVDYLKHTLTYIPWNPMIADSWNELLKLMNAHLRQLVEDDQYRIEINQYINEFEHPVQQFEIHEVLITYYFQTKQFDQALEEANHQLKLTDHIDDTSYQSRAFNTKGVIYHVLGQIDKAEIWYKQSYDILEDIDHLEHYQLFDRTLYSLANLYMHYAAEFDNAVKYYKLAHTLAKENENLERQAFFLDHIGMAQYWIENYEKAIEYHKQAWELLKDQERSINVLFHKVQLSMALAKLGKYEEVGNELYDIIDLKNKNTDAFSNTLYLILLSDFWKKKPENFRNLQKEFQEKLNESFTDPTSLIQLAKSVALHSQHIPSIVSANLKLAEDMIEENPAEAITLLAESKHLAIQNNRLREVKEIKRVIEMMGMDYETL